MISLRYLMDVHHVLVMIYCVNNKIAVKNAKLELILNMLIKEVVIDVNLCIAQEILVNAQVWMFLNFKCLTFLNKIY